MTRPEFARVMAYLGAAVGKPVSAETAEVYFSLLGDLPAPALEAAAQLALLEHRFPTLPTVAQLRELATEALAGEPLPDPPEAVALVWKVLGGLSCDREERKAALPAAVRDAAAAFGWHRLANTTDPGTTGAQFREFYAAVARRARRERLLPDAVRRQLKALAGPEKPGLRLLGGGDDAA